MPNEQGSEFDSFLPQLLSGTPQEIPTRILSKDGNPIKLSVVFLPSSGNKKWILTTAVANDNAIGFIDAEFIPDTDNGIIEAPYYNYLGPGHTPPYEEIRSLAGDDGFFVIEGERNNGIGSQLFLHAVQFLAGLGAKRVYVNQPKEQSKSFYRRHGGIDNIGGYHWNLPLK